MKKKSSIFLKTKIALAIQSYFLCESGEIGFMGGGEGGAGEGGEGGAGAGEGGVPYAYPEGFDEKLKGDATLLKYADDKGNFNQGNIMKALVHATGMIGKDKMPVPDDTWTDDQYNELFNKMGRPEDIKEYGLVNNMPDGVEANEEFFNGVKEAAYKAGLSTKQAQSMSDFINNFLGESVNKNNEMSQASKKVEADKLRADWGDKYDYKNKRAFSALEQFATKEEIADMSAKGLLESPVITRLFDKIANGMAEDSLKVEGGNTFGMTGEEAGKEIQSYYVKGHPFSTKGHPEQKFYQEKMQKLQKIKLAARKG